MVGRGGLEPLTSALAGLQRSTTESAKPLEMSGVIRLEPLQMDQLDAQPNGVLRPAQIRYSYSDTSKTAYSA